QAFEIRPQWQMCFGLWGHGITERPDLSLMAQRQPGFAPILRVAGLGLRDAIGYDDTGQLMRSTESGLVPARETLVAHVLATAQQLAADRERLRTEPIAPASATAGRSTVTLKLQAAADAIPAGLRRALDELGGTFQVEVLDEDGEDRPAQLDAFASRTDDAILMVVLDGGYELEVSASTPLAAGGPLSVFIQSVANPTNDRLAAAAVAAFERALAAVGKVVERSTNF